MKFSLTALAVLALWVGAHGPSFDGRRAESSAGPSLATSQTEGAAGALLAPNGSRRSIPPCFIHGRWVAGSLLEALIDEDSEEESESGDGPAIETPARFLGLATSPSQLSILRLAAPRRPFLDGPSALRC